MRQDELPPGQDALVAQGAIVEASNQGGAEGGVVPGKTKARARGAGAAAAARRRGGPPGGGGGDDDAGRVPPAPPRGRHGRRGRHSAARDVFAVRQAEGAQGRARQGTERIGRRAAARAPDGHARAALRRAAPPAGPSLRAARGARPVLWQRRPARGTAGNRTLPPRRAFLAGSHVGSAYRAQATTGATYTIDRRSGSAGRPGAGGARWSYENTSSDRRARSNWARIERCGSSRPAFAR